MFSYTSLLITGLLCVVGVLANIYNDTLWQRVGLGILSWGCFGRATVIWNTAIVQGDWVFVHIGMATFASATAVKCYRQYERDKKDSDYSYGRRSTDRHGTLA
jgi:hypothetical protein